MLMANLDVTTHVLTWCITLVADHEAAQRELREEVAANKHNLHEYLTRNDTHLHRCFYESLRLRPLAGKHPICAFSLTFSACESSEVRVDAKYVAAVFSIGASAPSVKNFHGVLVKPDVSKSAIVHIAVEAN
jgi:gliotoxin/aspirochlorine/mycotoxins biosynthesis cytochrome P450 monooxygenase